VAKFHQVCVCYKGNKVLTLLGIVRKRFERKLEFPVSLDIYTIKLLEDTNENQEHSIHFCLGYYIHKMVSMHKRQRKFYFPFPILALAYIIDKSKFLSSFGLWAMCPIVHDAMTCGQTNVFYTKPLP